MGMRRNKKNAKNKLIVLFVINYCSDRFTLFVLQVIVILRMDCVLGLTHGMLWKMSLIGQGVVVQRQVTLRDQQLITLQAQRKVGTYSVIRILSLSAFVTSVCVFS